MLPSWIPFKTLGKKATAPTVKVNQKQPVNYSPTFEILAECTLQLSNLGNNNNKYYVLELHHDPKVSKSQYRIFCHYGRTCFLTSNPKSGQRCYRYFDSLQNARVSEIMICH